MRPADDGNLPWTGVLFGLTISSIWYWCSDQVGKWTNSTTDNSLDIKVWIYKILLCLSKPTFSYFFYRLLCRELLQLKTWCMSRLEPYWLAVLKFFRYFLWSFPEWFHDCCTQVTIIYLQETANTLFHCGCAIFLLRYCAIRTQIAPLWFLSRQN